MAIDFLYLKKSIRVVGGREREMSLEDESIREGDLEEDLPYDAGDMIGESQPPPPPSTTVLSENKENGPILPPPLDVQPEEGLALREWRR